MPTLTEMYNFYSSGDEVLELGPQGITIKPQLTRTDFLTGDGGTKTVSWIHNAVRKCIK